MSEAGKTKKTGRSPATGQFMQVDGGRSSKPVPGPVLTGQGPGASRKTGQVLKSVSSIHSEALARLKDR